MKAKKTQIAENGIAQLREAVDTIITIPNNRLLELKPRAVTLLETFKKANQVLYYAVKGIANLIAIRGLANVDFADVRTITEEKGLALMGTGISSGDNRSIEAAQRAIRSPLLEDVSIKGAKGPLWPPLSLIFYRNCHRH